MLDILFVMDYVCPYCLAAKAAIDQALEGLKAEAKLTIQPLELTQEPSPGSIPAAMRRERRGIRFW